MNMNPTNTSVLRRAASASRVLIAASLLSLPILLCAADAPALLDDFSNPDSTPTGGIRPVITDKELGGKSEATVTCANGVFAVEGKLVPGRGAPAFVSIPLLMSPDAQPQDLSNREGVRLSVKVKKGILAVQVSSTEITNFDYHVSAPIARQPGDFQEVRIPFAAMKRAWSEQTPLNLKTITSINLVASGMAATEFAYEVDEIGFY